MPGLVTQVRHAKLSEDILSFSKLYDCQTYLPELAIMCIVSCAQLLVYDTTKRNNLEPWYALSDQKKDYKAIWFSSLQIGYI